MENNPIASRKAGEIFPVWPHRPGLVLPGETWPGMARPGQAMPGQTWLGQGRGWPGQAWPGQVGLLVLHWLGVMGLRTVGAWAHTVSGPGPSFLKEPSECFPVAAQDSSIRQHQRVLQSHHPPALRTLPNRHQAPLMQVLSFSACHPGGREPIPFQPG